MTGRKSARTGAQCDDEGGARDEECELGWDNEGDQSRLRAAPDHDEPELGWTEEIDQTRNNEQDPNVWLCEDGEPDLGFVGHGTGYKAGETTDDREDDDERQPNGDEDDFNGGDLDAPVFIPGGGSVSQREDGWRPAEGSAVAPAMLEKAHKLSNGDIAREIIDRRDAARTRKLANRIELRRHGWNSEGIGNLPPEAFETFIPEIGHHRPMKH